MYPLANRAGKQRVATREQLAVKIDTFLSELHTWLIRFQGYSEVGFGWLSHGIAFSGRTAISRVAAAMLGASIRLSRYHVYGCGGPSPQSRLDPP